MTKRIGKFCHRCGKEGEPAEESSARRRFDQKVRTGLITKKEIDEGKITFESFLWLKCCGKPWGVKK